MAVDVVTETVLDHPRELVASFAGNPVLRNRGAPSGFGALTARALAAAMRRANRKDLARLAEVHGRP